MDAFPLWVARLDIETKTKTLKIESRDISRPRLNEVLRTITVGTQVVFAYLDIRYLDIRIYPLILWQPKIRIS